MLGALCLSLIINISSRARLRGRNEKKNKTLWLTNLSHLHELRGNHNGNMKCFQLARISDEIFSTKDALVGILELMQFRFPFRLKENRNVVVQVMNEPSRARKILFLSSIAR
jgi:hypothetical protein